MAVELEGVAVELEGVAVELVGAVDLVVDDSGTVGRGQVTSCNSGSTYSRILRYKYHCRNGARPVGVRSSGNSLEDGDQSSFNKSKSTSVPSDFVFAKT